MFKSLMLIAKLAKPIKVVLTPQEWGILYEILKGSKPHWHSIAEWALNDAKDKGFRGDRNWDWVADLDPALKNIDTMLKRRPHGEVLFFNISVMTAIGLTNQYELRSRFAPMIADQALSEEHRNDLRKIEAILLSVEQKLEAILTAEGVEKIFS
jgi:hypothetical protein